MKRTISLIMMLFSYIILLGQGVYLGNKFQQLGVLLPDANSFRTASGAPGFQYWQQNADYKIKITLDDNKHTIAGEEIITYYNNSPDPLNYLWLQLDQNMRAKNSLRNQTQTGEISENMESSTLRYLNFDFDGGFKLLKVADIEGAELKYTVNETMMRIDLPATLKSGESFSFQIKWWYNINNRDEYWGRSGMEYFPKDDNYLYTIAQFYPRMAVYSDFAGWQHKQFLGRGEFALTFGDYDVEITVPEDHIVAATGELQNADEVLTKTQIGRLNEAKLTKTPVLIVDQKEAEKKEKTKSNKLKTWKFSAKNVRDFAFASSRKFIWDAMGVTFGERTVMAMSFYPKEGNPLWEKYSTQVVAHTIRTYSKYTFDYPYPVAQSVHSKSIGMEYPMICFNGGRPDEDGTYSENTKFGMLGVIIHEVGHNFFPMIVNSDERQWTWMDEGLNTFLQYMTQNEWDRNFPSRNGSPELIVDYMRTNKSDLSPIMMNPEIVKSHHNSQYGKPAAILTVLRETVMGRELFDFAFREYANRWKFKHPTPADFFRTMEDASAVDLDWFWRGWFYTTDHVDISIDKVQFFKLSNGDPASEKTFEKELANSIPKTIQYQLDKEVPSMVDKHPELKDFYDNYNPYESTKADAEKFKFFKANLSEEDKAFVTSNNIYIQIDFSNIGGLIMPIILKFEYEDGSSEVIKVPVEVWRSNTEQISKVFVRSKNVRKIILDPYRQTADTDLSNNYWPEQKIESRFQLYKKKLVEKKNAMQLNKN